MLDRTKIQTTKPIYPQIYAYTTPTVASNEGWIKIGYTERKDVDKRIKEQTHTAGIMTKKLWSEEAKFNTTNQWFKDKQFHTYLRQYKQVQQRTGLEWFFYNGTPEKAYADFQDFKNERYDQSTEKLSYVLRKEQQEAVNKTLDYIKWHKQGEFLWNAKPRFGKTLTTYDLIRQLNAINVLIVTNRPAIANSWFDDFEKFIAWQTDYKFVSTSDSLKDRPALTREQFKQMVIDGEVEHNIHFISLQDLKGAIAFGGMYDKLSWVKDLEWDILVIDESHEGVDTFKTDIAFNEIRRDFTLYLSGTPFKALASGQFRGEQIFNWTYTDEQEAKLDWDKKATDGSNPYANLPQLNMFTYQMGQMIADEVNQGAMIEGENRDYTFDLNEFFETTDSGKFVHEKDVLKWLDTLTHNEKYPFSTPQLRQELKHTFWLLNRVDSVKALERLLRNHPVFENYKIIVAAGDGRASDEDGKVSMKAFNRVKEAVKTYDKTITLSVGQLTTGVTIPEWTAVLMLSNMKSPSQYMQSAFRAQNPWTYEVNGEVRQKENAYVFDFAPERTLMIYDEFANNLSHKAYGGQTTPIERHQNIQTLLNFFPVIAEDSNGKMVALDVDQVLTIPRTIKAQEVVKRGFMSNLLFQNISGIFANADARQIIEQLNPVEEGKSVPRKADTEIDTKAIQVDEFGDVLLDQNIIINKAQAHFGQKIYENLQSTVETTSTESTETLSRALAKTFTESAQASIKSLVVENGLSMSVAKQVTKQGEETIAREIEILEKRVDIKRKEEELAYQKRIASEKDEQRLREEKQAYDYRLQEIQEAFKQDVITTVTQKAEEVATQSTETVLKKAKEKEKHTVEDDVRARLRGFSRTIPSFLMAYGTPSTTLMNFDQTIKDDVFKAVTGITLAQFRRLRDDYRFFDEVVFNESVQTFLTKRQELADYFNEAQQEDIFDYIPPQQTNQIFTPKKVVKMMIDQLEAENPELFKDPTKTFVDLYVKSGLYLTELVKRLYVGLADKIPNDADRLKHILEHQIYGFAPSEIIYNIARNFIFGFDESAQTINDSHIVYLDTTPYAKGETEKSLAEKCEELFGGEQVKFDVVVGNPPYQESDGGAQASASPIYHKFVELTKTLNSNYISLIMPSRWYTGGKGMDEFREKMLSDTMVRSLYDFPNPDEVFPNTNIRGGVCIVHWDSDWDNQINLTRTVTVERGKVTAEVYRRLAVDGLSVFVRNHRILNVLSKIKETQYKGDISEIVSPRKPYGLSGFFVKDKNFHSKDTNLNNPVRCYGKGKVGYVERSEIKNKTEWIDCWKVFTARANNIGTELNDDNFNTIIGGPGTVCTETYIVIGADLDLTEQQAYNLSNYLKTRFARLLHATAKSSQDAARMTYKFIPIQDFTEKSDIDWTKSISEIDQQLYRKYGLSQEEIDFIEEKVKGME